MATMPLDGRVLPTRERLFVELLTGSGIAALQASATAKRVYWAWEFGHHRAAELFGSGAEAEARVALLRWWLLAGHDARRLPGDPSLRALQAYGYDRPDGWLLAPRRSLAVPDAPAPDSQALPSGTPAGSWEKAVEALRAPGLVAVCPTVLRHPALEVRLTLGGGAAAPQELLQWHDGVHTSGELVGLPDAVARRTMQVLFDAFCAIDGLALSEQQKADARRVVQDRIWMLVADGVREPKAVIAQVVRELAPELLEGPDPVLPDTAPFTAIARALERFAGPDCGPPEWLAPGVHVDWLDAAGRNVLATGRVVGVPMARARRVDVDFGRGRSRVAIDELRLRRYRLLPVA